MEFCICYEQFIQITSYDNCEELKKDFMLFHNDDDNKVIKYISLLLLPNMMPRYTCQNEKCCKYICDYCYENTINLKDMFQCPYCRMNDYKAYMKKNVLRELQIKVLGKDGFIKLLIEQISDIECAV